MNKAKIILNHFPLIWCTNLTIHCNEHQYLTTCILFFKNVINGNGHLCLMTQHKFLNQIILEVTVLTDSLIHESNLLTEWPDKKNNNNKKQVWFNWLCLLCCLISSKIIANIFWIFNIYHPPLIPAHTVSGFFVNKLFLGVMILKPCVWIWYALLCVCSC